MNSLSEKRLCEKYNKSIYFFFIVNSLMYLTFIDHRYLFFCSNPHFINGFTLYFFLLPLPHGAQGLKGLNLGNVWDLQHVWA